MPSLQDIFNELMLGASVTVQHFDKADYDSTVVCVRRKFRNFVKLMDDIGGEHGYMNHYVQITFDRDKCEGTYKIEEIEKRQRVRKNYAAEI